MTGTNFANPNGLDADGHYSTGNDLITLGLAAIEYPRIMETTSLRAITFDPGTRDPIPVINTNRLLGSLVGSTPKWFRPPGESRHPELNAVAEECGVRVVRWTVDPYDASRPGALAIVERVLSLVRPGGVIMLHCGVRDTVEALPMLLRSLRQRGYRPVALGELG